MSRSPAPRSPASSAPRDRNRESADRERGRSGGSRRGNPAAAGSGSAHWLWGQHPVLAALANPARRLRRIVATPEAQTTHAAALAEAARTRAATLPPVETLERAKFDLLLPDTAVHQGLALLTEPLPAPTLEELIVSAAGLENAVVMLLDQVTDPHNVGAILRSSAAFGALALVVPDRHAPEETGTLAKSASGALERLPLIRVTNLVRALEQLKAGGFWVAGMAGEAERTLAAAKLSGKIALVMGSEGDGLRRLTREHCDLLVKLPQTELVESLNVSNAAAVALYELTRR